MTRVEKKLPVMGEKEVGGKVKCMINSLDTHFFRIYADSTVLPCTADSRDPYSWTSSLVLGNSGCFQLSCCFGFFWIF